MLRALVAYIRIEGVGGFPLPRLSKEATLGKMMTSIFKVPEPVPLFGVLPSGFEDFIQARLLSDCCGDGAAALQ